VREIDFAQEFGAMGRTIEAATRPPAYDAIRAIRRRRTRRWAMAGVVVVVLLSSLLARALQVVQGSPFEVVAPWGGSVPALVAVAAAPSGTVFGVAQSCTEECDTPQDFKDPVHDYTLIRSTDLALSWNVVGPVPGVRDVGLRLFVVDDSRLWLTQVGRVWSTANGGRDWWQWDLGNDGNGRFDAGVAGGTAWVAWDGVLRVATSGSQPTPAGPGGVIVRVHPVSSDRSYAVDDGGGWFVTLDRGGEWSATADPCLGLPGEEPTLSTVAATHDGVLWLLCAGPPNPGEQSRWLRISTDGGGSWVERGAIESTGYPAAVYPMSSTVAWRTGSAIYRTTDGLRWTTVAEPSYGPAVFAAVDGTTAVYTDRVDSLAVFVTVDGGRTWSRRPFSL